MITKLVSFGFWVVEYDATPEGAEQLALYLKICPLTQSYQTSNIGKVLTNSLMSCVIATKSGMLHLDCTQTYILWARTPTNMIMKEIPVP